MAIYESVDAAARLMAVDADDDSLDNMNPIFGVDEAPDLSFTEAAKLTAVSVEFPFFFFLFFLLFFLFKKPASLVPGYAATWDVSSRPANVGNEHVYAVHDVRNHV